MRRILHPLPEVPLLVVCGGVADCDDHEDIAAWRGAQNMSAVRDFALKPLRAAADKRCIKPRRYLAGWSADHFDAIHS